MTGDGLRSPSLEAQSSAGGVRLSFDVAPDRVRATSSAGGVEVLVPPGSGPYAVDASSSAGSSTVGVRQDPRAEHTIMARSSAGSVSVRERGAPAQ